MGSPPHLCWLNAWGSDNTQETQDMGRESEEGRGLKWGVSQGGGGAWRRVVRGEVWSLLWGFLGGK